jgi:hypothetical protein
VAGLVGAAEGDPSFAEIVRGEFHRDFIAGQNADVIFAHLAGDVRRNYVTVFEFDPEHGIGQGFCNGALHLDMVLLGHQMPVVVNSGADYQIKSSDWQPLN